MAGQKTVKKQAAHSVEKGLAKSIGDHLVHSIGKVSGVANRRDWFEASAYALRDSLVERWSATISKHYREDARRVYYLSMEFLIGRSLSNAALNLDLEPKLREGLHAFGQELDEVREIENDAGLGNGGLGRLAACFLDSMATLDVPSQGYGIRYEYGMFNQHIEHGVQVEAPDNWLRYGNPWELPRPERLYPVTFYGQAVTYQNERGSFDHGWIGGEMVMAMAYDFPVPGYGTETVGNLRLWAAKATREFNLRSFNEGDYVGALVEKDLSETLSKVLYPDDTSSMGRELRLRQEYFFVSASIQDILHRFLTDHSDWDALPQKVAIQLNDTHPAIAPAELMYQLLDKHHLSWEQAWSYTSRIFAYTNHTLMPEALESWPLDLFRRVLPRHLEIIFEINHRFLESVRRQIPGDDALLRRVSVIDEEQGKRVRMAHLAVICSHTVNGVAAIHSELLKSRLFADFYRIFPERFINVTNGITPRRWLNLANPGLTGLIASRIGKDFVRDLSQLERLLPYAEDAEFRRQFRAVKQANKAQLAEHIEHKLGLRLDPESLFDVQVKRIHEYKRQLLNILHVVTLYERIRLGQPFPDIKRTVIFGGKAAPGYRMAKLIVRLINDVAATVNYDLQVGERLKVVFYPNYDVSSAEKIIPAADLSEQISTAGTEASGTGNMKLALNGALTIGTLDGANVEIRNEVGRENIFIFGLTAEEVENVRRQGYNPWDFYQGNPELKRVLDLIGSGYFSPEDPERYRPLIDSLLGGDHYMVLADYAQYVAAQDAVGELYADPEQWSRRAILNVARMGRFSSDRTIREYAEKIWKVTPSA